ncbi:MAG: lipoprotein [Sphaerochaetaceae bacterium]
MKRLAKLIPLGMVFVVLLSSCATMARKEALPYYDFQGMADSGVIVVTVDAQKEHELIDGVFSGMQEFGDRAERISLSLSPKENGYPLEADALEAYGVIEGDYPKWLVNTAMMYAKEFTRHYAADEITYFQQKDGTLSIYSPNNDKVLFTTTEYPEAYTRYKAERQLIDLVTASDMASSSIAVYASEPETFFDLGLDLPDTVITQAKVMLLLINQKADGGYSLDAYITMDTPKLATTLSQMVRTGYLARLKRERIPFKIAELMQMFLIEDDLVTIRHMDLDDEQMNNLKQSLSGML